MADDLIVLDPWPRRAEAIFAAGRRARLDALGRVVACDSRSSPQDFERLLPDAVAIIGQPDLPAERLERAKQLRVLVNVEGNFLPNVDYLRCLERGIHVLSVAPAFAVPVAEMCIALALDLARGVTTGDRAMRGGTELYGSRGNLAAVHLSRARVGIVGYGNIGRALRRILRGFSAEVLVHDPWLPRGVVLEDDAMPVALDQLLVSAGFIFVLAGVTSENRGFLGREALSRIAADAIVVLGSRAGVVDFDAFVALANAGRFRAATDVFPEEPVPAADAVRSSKVLLSAHRAGGTPATFETMAEMILDDLSLILRRLPPVRLQPARRETVTMMRSPPAIYSPK